MTSYIIGLISDFIGSSANTINSFLTDLYYYIFYIEIQFNNLNIDFNAIYKTIYSWAIIILIIVFIKNMIQNYFLFKSGDDNNSPTHLLVGLFEAIIIMITFGWIYTFVIDLGADFFKSLLSSSTSDYDIADLGNIAKNGLFQSFLCIVFLITILILIWQFIRRGVELLIMRCIIPLSCIGLLSSNGGSFSVLIKKFMQNLFTVILQLFLLNLSLELAKGGHLIYAIAVSMVCTQTPQFLQDFLVGSTGFGIMAKASGVFRTTGNAIRTTADMSRAGQTISNMFSFGRNTSSNLNARIPISTTKNINGGGNNNG